MYFEYYQQNGGGLLNIASSLYGQWRWRLWSSNGRIIADSAESYHNESDCLHGINLVKGTNGLTPVRKG